MPSGSTLHWETPTKFSLWYRLVRPRLADGRAYEEAERYTRRLLELTPGFPIGVFTHAEVLLAQGRADEALSAIEPHSRISASFRSSIRFGRRSASKRSWKPSAGARVVGPTSPQNISEASGSSGFSAS